MEPHIRAKLAKKVVVIYVVLALALSYFAIYPSLSLGGGMTLFITLYWMLVLAGIVTAYGVAVVFCSGEESPDGAGH